MPFRLGRFFRSFFRENATSRLTRLERSRFARLEIEPLERRDVPAAPVINGIIGGNAAGTIATLGADAALTLGIDGADSDGDAVTISATIENASSGLQLEAIVHNRTKYAVLNFIRADNAATIGSITVELFEDWSSTTGNPATERFITLSTMHIEPDGTPVPPTPSDPAFYTNVIVHRVADLTGPPNNSFIIQTGDAQNGNGTGGSPMGDFPDAFDEFLGFSGPGVLAMANSGPNSNDSQWFLTGGPTQHLNQKHMIFGQIVKGMDIFQQVQALGNNGSRLADVDIIEETDPSVLQDGVIRLRSLNGTGGTATLKITLDDGTNETVQNVNVTVLGMLGNQAPQHVGMGDYVFDPVIVGHENKPFSVVGSFPTPLPGASVSYYSGQVHVVAPNSFGTFEVSIKVTRNDGYTATRVFEFTRQPGQGSQFVGNLLYVAAGEAGLQIFNVNNLTTPLDTFDTDGYARDVKVVGNVAYVADDANGLVTLNVANPSDITELDQLSLPVQVDGSGTPKPGRAFSLFLDGTTAYVASFHGGVNVVNITDPANLLQVQNVKGPISRAMTAVKQGSLLYVADLNQGILVFNSNNLAGGAIATVSGSYFGLAVRDGKVYGVDTFDDSLKIFDADVVDPPGPLGPTLNLLGSVFAGADATFLTLSPEGRQAVIGTKDGFTIVDLSNPASPDVDATLAGLSGGGLASFGGNHQLALPYTLHPPKIVAAAYTGSQTFINELGHQVTVTIVNGLVFVSQDELTGRITSIDVLQGGPTTDLTITTSNAGGSSIDQLQVGDSTDPNDHTAIRKILAPNIDISDDLFVAGNVGTLKLGNVSGDWDINGKAGYVTLAATDSLWAANFGGVVTSLIISGDCSGALTAPAIATFQAVSLTDATLKLTRPVNPNKPKLKNVTSLIVNGTMDGSSIESKGHVGKIIVRAMVDSHIHVGINDGVTGLPGASDFQANRAKAALIKVKGLGGSTDSFVNSVIAGGKLTEVVVTNVQPSNGGNQFGVVAQFIGKYVRREGLNVVKSASSVSAGLTPTVIETVADYLAQVVPD